jgi:hypothetical protein
LEAGIWQASFPRPVKGRHFYKFLLDDQVWIPDPANAIRAHDGYGSWNSVLIS